MGNRYKLAFWTLLVVVLVPTALIGGCSLTYRGLTERQEVTRVPAPGGKVEAVLVEVLEPEGATGGLKYELHVVATGEGAEGLSTSESLLTVSRARDLDLRWHSDDLLEIGYDDTELSNFQNYKYVGGPKGGGVVELQLVPPGDGRGLS